MGGEQSGGRSGNGRSNGGGRGNNSRGSRGNGRGNTGYSGGNQRNQLAQSQNETQNPFAVPAIPAFNTSKKRSRNGTEKKPQLKPSGPLHLLRSRRRSSLPEGDALKDLETAQERREVLLRQLDDEAAERGRRIAAGEVVTDYEVETEFLYASEYESETKMEVVMDSELEWEEQTGRIYFDPVYLLPDPRVDFAPTFVDGDEYTQDEVMDDYNNDHPKQGITSTSSEATEELLQAASQKLALENAVTPEKTEGSEKYEGGDESVPSVLAVSTSVTAARRAQHKEGRKTATRLKKMEAKGEKKKEGKVKERKKAVTKRQVLAAKATRRERRGKREVWEREEADGKAMAGGNPKARKAAADPEVRVAARNTAAALREAGAEAKAAKAAKAEKETPAQKQQDKTETQQQEKVHNAATSKCEAKPAPKTRSSATKKVASSAARTTRAPTSSVSRPPPPQQATEETANQEVQLQADRQARGSISELAPAAPQLAPAASQQGTQQQQGQQQVVQQGTQREEGEEGEVGGRKKSGVFYMIFSELVKSSGSPAGEGGWIEK